MSGCVSCANERQELKLVAEVGITVEVDSVRKRQHCCCCSSCNTKEKGDRVPDCLLLRVLWCGVVWR